MVFDEVGFTFQPNDIRLEYRLLWITCSENNFKF